MSDLRKAAEMALITLEEKLAVLEPTKYAETIEALRQALAQPEQERVIEITRQFVGVKEDGSERWVETEYRTTTKNEWVELTDEEAWGVYRTHGLSFHRPNHVEEYEWALCMRDFARAIEAKLKEKNT